MVVAELCTRDAPSALRMYNQRRLERCTSKLSRGNFCERIAGVKRETQRGPELMLYTDMLCRCPRIQVQRPMGDPAIHKSTQLDDDNGVKVVEVCRNVRLADTGSLPYCERLRLSI